MRKLKIDTDDTNLSKPALHTSDRVLRVLGTSVTQIEPMKRAAEQDLGIKLEFITLDGNAAQRRGALQPESFDIYDQWYHNIDLIWPTSSLKGVQTDRINRWDEVNRLPKSGSLMSNLPSASGGDASNRMYLQYDGSLGSSETDLISMLPTVNNADSFGVLGTSKGIPDSWGCLLDDEWAGRVILQRDAAIGCLDICFAMQARGEMSFNDIGNLSLEEIEALTDKLHHYHNNGHFRDMWSDDNEAIAAMSTEPPVIGSLWWSGLIKLRARGIPVVMATPREGYRGWFGGIGISTFLEGVKLDMGYDYFNWWLDGKAGAIMARNGAYMSNPEAVRSHLSEDEWRFWYDGEPAASPIVDAEGNQIFDIGETRGGGSYFERMSRVAVWNAVMDEHNYLVRRWEHAVGG